MALLQRVRFAVALPIAQLFLAIGLNRWGLTEGCPMADTPCSPTATQICRAINAPAALLMLLADLFHRVDHAPPSVFGLPLGDLLFFSGVVLLWFIVGRAVDNRGHLGASAQVPMFAAVVFRALLLALGLLLFLMSLGPLFFRMSLNNSSGSIAAGILIMLWSAALVGTSALWFWKRAR